ncbi:MAG: hypothetical protein ACHQ50_10575, partial [Fimbriimonadales bacterium]
MTHLNSDHGREARGSEPRIPEDLLTAPGTRKDRSEEAYFNRVYPEAEFNIGSKVGRAYAYLNAQGEARKRVKAVWDARSKALHERHQQLETIEPNVAPSGDDITADIKAESRRLGLSAIGITRFDRIYAYSNAKRRIRRLPHVIVLALER